MRNLLFILSILFSLNSFSQKLNVLNGTRYCLFIYYGCENQIKRINEYVIEVRTTDSIIIYRPDTFGICFLPKGIYTHYYLRAPLVDTELSIDKNKELITDTISVPPIYKAPTQTKGFTIGPTYYQYYKCGEQCNGFQKTYREDGQLWQKGQFKRGKLKCLKTYYPNGKCESIIKDRLLNWCNSTYDKSGKLKLKLNNFLFISHAKFYDDEKEKYVENYDFGRFRRFK